MGHKKDSKYIVVPEELKDRFKKWSDSEGRSMVGHLRVLVEKHEKKK